MPAIQTSFAETHAIAYEGQRANTEGGLVTVTRIAETAAGIGFGKVVVVGTNDNHVRVSEAGRAFEGISLLDPAQPADLYAQYASVAVMKKGVIWVTASVAVTKGQPVYFVPATGVLTNSATGNTLIANATWDTSTTGAGLAKLRLA